MLIAQGKGSLKLGALYSLLEINHDLRVLQSLTTDFFSYRLFSRFSRLAAPKAAQLELSGQNQHVPP